MIGIVVRVAELWRRFFFTDRLDKLDRSEFFAFFLLRAFFAGA